MTPTSIFLTRRWQVSQAANAMSPSRAGDFSLWGVARLVIAALRPAARIRAALLASTLASLVVRPACARWLAAVRRHGILGATCNCSMVDAPVISISVSTTIFASGSRDAVRGGRCREGVALLCRCTVLTMRSLRTAVVGVGTGMQWPRPRHRLPALFADRCRSSCVDGWASTSGTCRRHRGLLRAALGIGVARRGALGCISSSGTCRCYWGALRAVLGIEATRRGVGERSSKSGACRCY